MLNLLRLHWTANRRILAQILPLFAFWGFAFYLGEARLASVAVHYLSILVAMVLASVVLLQGMNTPLEPFLLALPVRRDQVVTVTYLVALGAVAVGVLVPVVAHALTTRHSPEWSITALILGFLASGILAFLPLRFALGGTRGLTTFAGLVLAVGVALFIWKGPGAVDTTLRDAAGACLAHPVLGAMGLLTLGGLSHASARWIYARRSF